MLGLGNPDYLQEHVLFGQLSDIALVLELSADEYEELHLLVAELDLEECALVGYGLLVEQVSFI